MKTRIKIIIFFVANILLCSTPSYSLPGQAAHIPNISDAQRFLLLHSQITHLHRAFAAVLPPPPSAPSYRQRLGNFCSHPVGSVIIGSIATASVNKITKYIPTLLMTPQEKALFAVEQKIKEAKSSLFQKSEAINKYKERLAKSPEESPKHQELSEDLKLTEDSYFKENKELIKLEKQKNTLLGKAS